MEKWLSDRLVLEFYEGRDYPFHAEKVYQTFFEPDDSVVRCIVLYKDSAIGYIQYYLADKEIRKVGHYGPSKIVYGMDQFIGEATYWNQGIGTLLIKSMIVFLKKQLQADVIVMDPQIENKRALRCYEKCGFSPVTVLPAHEWHEGKYRDCLLIENRV